MAKQVQSIEKRIAALRVFEKRMSTIAFVVCQIKATGECRVRFGKKFIVVDTPSRDWAKVVVAEMTAVIDRQRDKIRVMLETLEKHCEQLALDLFTEEAVNGEAEGFGEREGLVSDTITESVARGECPGGFLDNTGVGGEAPVRGTVVTLGGAAGG